ncbi:hypothetical protein T12_12464, partial [Trichinella patagoniensis]
LGISQGSALRQNASESLLLSMLFWLLSLKLSFDG